MIRKIWYPHHMTRWILYLNCEQQDLKKDTKMEQWQSSVSRGDVECVIKVELPLFFRLVIIKTVKFYIFVIHELVEIAIECMLNKSICKNKNCCLFLFNIIYIIIVFTLFNYMLMCHFFAVHVVIFAIVVISNRWILVWILRNKRYCK